MPLRLSCVGGALFMVALYTFRDRSDRYFASAFSLNGLDYPGVC